MSTFMLVTGCGALVLVGCGVGWMVPSDGNMACVFSNAAVTAVRIMATAASAISGSISLVLNFSFLSLKTRGDYYVLINNIVEQETKTKL